MSERQPTIVAIAKATAIMNQPLGSTEAAGDGRQVAGEKALEPGACGRLMSPPVFKTSVSNIQAHNAAYHYIRSERRWQRKDSVAKEDPEVDS